MKRLSAVLASGVTLLAGAGAAAVFVLAGPSGAKAPAATPAADAGLATFLDVTAEHFCGVQSSVYADPTALAEAYAATPDYDGLPASEVASYQQRLKTDAGLSAELSQRIAATCS